ncbi:MAG: putative DNA binding domain-containing protein [Bacteroidia bacterium]|nr:putative DNA binding domain-containing protein [Bacteroidia bacterium]
MTKEELDIILRQGEGYNIEFKKSYSKDIPEEICGFANTTGGILLIGIANDNSVYGTVVDNSKRSQLQQSIDAINPRVPVRYSEINFHGKTIIIIDCPSGAQKPYIYHGAIFIRIGANTQKLTSAEEMRDFFQQQLRIYFDESPCHTFKFPNDFDFEQFESFLRKANITATLPEKAILENLKLLTDDKFLKNGAALFFAKDPTKHYENISIRCLLFKGTDKRFIHDDKEFKGNLIRQYNDAVEWLYSKLELRYDIESQGTKPRKEYLEIPDIAMKEVIINALSHRDYYEKGAVIQIEIYDNRIEISNPGGLVSCIKPVEFFGLPEPVFQTEGIFTVCLYRPVRFEKWLEQWQKIITVNQKNILIAINFDNKITIGNLCKKTGIGTTAVNNNIRKLKILNILSRKGTRKKGFWNINMIAHSLEGDKEV